MFCNRRRGRLVPGHCLIVPNDHTPSTRQVDEHIWTEIRNFKKCLLQMFMAQVRRFPVSLGLQYPWIRQALFTGCPLCATSNESGHNYMSAREHQHGRQ